MKIKLRMITIITVFTLCFTFLSVPANAIPLPEVVINEIMQNPNAVADSAGEWFELYNPTASDIDINGWTIKDNDIDSHMISNGGSLIIPAGGYLVLGNNGDSGTNGGVTVDYVYGSNWFLSNASDEIVLLDGGSNEIDRVEYDGGASFPDPIGASMALSNPALDNNTGSNWCTASTPYGDGDLGTPGAVNDCTITPIPPPPPDDIEVGGEVSSVNKVTFLTPWIAIAAVILVISGVTLALRRRLIQN